jgi:hypothetical protein
VLVAAAAAFGHVGLPRVVELGPVPDQQAEGSIAAADAVDVGRAVAGGPQLVIFVGWDDVQSHELVALVFGALSHLGCCEEVER